MGNFWKLWGSIAGGIVGAVVAVLASAGIATCTDAAMVSTCTVLGFSTTQITSFLTLVGSAIGTVIAPKNTG
jgi:hypothetical protein